MASLKVKAKNAKLQLKTKKFMKFSLRRGAGFTLIELMVVISIAAILIALGTVSYTTAQKKARDAKRRGDIKSAVGSAFEQYYSVNGEYDSVSTTCATIAADPVLPAGLPSDPKPGWTPYSFSCTADTYCVCSLLEADVGNSDGSCNFGAATTHFCVVNQQ